MKQKELIAPDGKVYVDSKALMIVRHIYLPNGCDESNFLLMSEEEAKDFVEKAMELRAQDEDVEMSEIDTVRAVQIAKVKEYDNSDAVNAFYVGGMPMWLDKATRASLRDGIEIEKKYANKDKTTLYVGINSIELPTDTALDMLAQVELYALASYRVTAGHIAHISQLSTIQEIQAYDYKVGYPEKLTFNL